MRLSHSLRICHLDLQKFAASRFLRKDAISLDNYATVTRKLETIAPNQRPITIPYPPRWFTRRTVKSTGQRPRLCPKPIRRPPDNHKMEKAVKGATKIKVWDLAQTSSIYDMLTRAVARCAKIKICRSNTSSNQQR